jgi:hypothetical protein
MTVLPKQMQFTAPLGPFAFGREQVVVNMAQEFNLKAVYLVQGNARDLRPRPITVRKVVQIYGESASKWHSCPVEWQPGPIETGELTFIAKHQRDRHHHEFAYVLTSNFPVGTLQPVHKPQG